MVEALSRAALFRYTDVKRKEDRSTFIRPHEGLFGLREWVEEGIDFKVSIHIRSTFNGILYKHLQSNYLISSKCSVE